MLSAIVFLSITILSYCLAIVKGPFWGLIAYANIYFNSPLPYINWWALYLPDIRWSLLTAAILVVSLFLHRNKLSNHKFHSIHWMSLFLIISVLLTFTLAFHQEDAQRHTYMIFTYCITVFVIIKSLNKFEYFRFFLLVIILFASNMSYKAYAHGKRINARLENIGTPDSFGANEFGLLLVTIIPLTLPFIIKGKRYEKAICILALPFLINAFILCNSRGAFVAFVGGIIYVFFFIADWKLKKYVLIALTGLIPLIFYLSDEPFKERMLTLWETDVLSEESLDAVSSGRIDVWKYGFNIVNDHPFGIGPNGFKHISRFYMPEEMLSYHPNMPYGVKAAHNSFLLVLVEQGFIGLVVFLLICFHTLYLLAKSVKRINKMGNYNSFLGILLIAMNISFVSILVGSMFTSRVYFEFFWWLIALSVVAYSFTLKTGN